jgi:hypothetical protein
LAGDVQIDAVMAELEARVRDRLREHLLRHGGSPAFADPDLFKDIERMLHAAVSVGASNASLLQELLGDPDTWRLHTAITYQSHREGRTAALILFVKKRLLMPILQFVFDYSRDNFIRQRRVNQVLFACVQELAIETARLRAQVAQLSDGRLDAARGSAVPDTDGPGPR